MVVRRVIDVIRRFHLNFSTRLRTRERLDWPFLISLVWSVLMSILSYYIWTSVKSSDIIYSLQALSHTIVWYRHSLDRNGSFIVFGYLLISISAKFYHKSFFMTVLLLIIASRVSSVVVKFMVIMALKKLFDFSLVYNNKCTTNIRCFEVASKVTDLLLLIVDVSALIVPGNLYKHIGIEDVILIAFYVAYIVIFTFQYFTENFLLYLIVLAFIYACIKSRRFGKVYSILNFYLS